jgi:hypothetical protein
LAWRTCAATSDRNPVDVSFDLQFWAPAHGGGL